LHCLCTANSAVKKLTGRDKIDAASLAMTFIESNPNSLPPIVRSLMGPEVCKVCKNKANVGSVGVVHCKYCTSVFHCQCLNINAELVPGGDWFCNSCFPLGEHIFYPPIKGNQLSPIEKARVMQICSGEADRLNEKQKIKLVEECAKKVSLPNGDKLFCLKR
jgi:hypothetical protein